MAAWKAWERFVAGVLGGVRRGPVVGDGESGGGYNDIAGLDGRYSVECKHATQIGFALILGACKQAMQAATNHEIPIAAIHSKGTPYEDGLLCVRVGDWQRLRLTLSCGILDGDNEQSTPPSQADS